MGCQRSVWSGVSTSGAGRHGAAGKPHIPRDAGVVGPAGISPETLYDHEVYSRPNDDKYANYDAMDHMNWKDFIEPGQWLDRRLLKNANLSYKNLVQKIPDEKKKRIRKPREGDYFPPESEDYRAGELRRERAEDREVRNSKKVQADVKKTPGKGGKK